MLDEQWPAIGQRPVDGSLNESNELTIQVHLAGLQRQHHLPLFLSTLSSTRSLSNRPPSLLSLNLRPLPIMDKRCLQVPFIPKLVAGGQAGMLLGGLLLMTMGGSLVQMAGVIHGLPKRNLETVSTFGVLRIEKLDVGKNDQHYCAAKFVQYNVF